MTYTTEDRLAFADFVTTVVVASVTVPFFIASVYDFCTSNNDYRLHDSDQIRSITDYSIQSDSYQIDCSSLGNGSDAPKRQAGCVQLDNKGSRAAQMAGLGSLKPQ